MHISEMFNQWKEVHPDHYGQDVNDEKLNPRQIIIRKFVEALNDARANAKNPDGTRMKLEPLQPSFIASKMYQSGLDTNDSLLWFFGYCCEAKNFGSCWWWSLKNK